MNDDRQDREDEIFRGERDKAQSRQDERDFLKDKSIGGQDAPRPTDDFIERSLGKDQSPSDMTREATDRTDKRMEGEDAKARNREAHARSERQQSQPEKEQKSPEQSRGVENAQSISERMKAKRDERRNRGHER